MGEWFEKGPKTFNKAKEGEEGNFEVKPRGKGVIDSCVLFVHKKGSRFFLGGLEIGNRGQPPEESFRFKTREG